MIKLVATDIDGTILGKSGEFTEGVKSCIKKLQENDVKVVIVTGRMHAAAKQIAERLNLDTPVVSYQGGLIKDKNNNILYEKYLPNDIVKQIITWGRMNNVHLNLYKNDILYSEQDDYEIKTYSKYQNLEYIVEDFTKISHNNVHKLLAIDYNDAERVTNWVDTMTKELPNLHICKSTPHFCEFSTLDATKYCAVKFLQNHWGFSDDEILTIGDQDNDIELLKAGGISVAMENGTDTLKQYADYVTDNVENDGFVKAIEKFVFKGEQ